MERRAKMQTRDMEAHSSKEGRLVEEPKKETIITLGEEEVDLRPVDDPTKTSVEQRELAAREANHFTKVIYQTKKNNENRNKKEKQFIA